LDCPICDQGGECDLQNQLEVFGLDHTRYTENIKKVAKVVNIGVVSFQMTRCIQCTRCVRFLTTVASNFDLGVIARGGKMKISKYLNTYLYNEFLSNIVDLCPVGSLQYNMCLKIKNLKFKNTVSGFFYFCGALTTASSAYRTRSWELYSKYTIDILDNIGADIRVDLKGTDIIRVLPRLNVAVNDHWITELTRYSFNGLKVQRLLLPYYKSSNNKHIATTWSLILDIYSKYIFVCNSILKKKLNWAGITSNLIDSKTAISFKRFLQANGSSNIESRSYQNQELLLDFVDMFSLKTVVFKESTIIFLIGINLRLEVPFYYLKIKQKKI
jgi:NADH-quinone oxidoreductase subunit G